MPRPAKSTPQQLPEPGKHSAYAISPFSGELATERWGYKDGSTIWVCPSTGALFFDRGERTASTYESYYPYLANFDATRAGYELALRRRRYNIQLAWAERYCTIGRRHLDVGAGPGYFCKVAIERGWDSIGVELSTDARRFGESHFSIRYEALEALPLESIDLITAHHVLEHIDNFNIFISHLSGLLRSNGLLVVHIPNVQPLSSLIQDLLLGRWGPQKERSCAMYADEHISGFTQRSLEQALAMHNFTIVTGFNCAQFSPHHDPWFLRDSIKDHRWSLLANRLIRAGIDTAGAFFGRGDWVVGLFRKG